MPVDFRQQGRICNRKQAARDTKNLCKPEYIGKGVGKALMQAAIEEAKQRDCDSVWLGVWEKNPRAIEFYKKWGFKEVGTHIFNVGDDPQRDFIMELRLDI